MEPCTANARRPTVDSRCHGTTISCCVADLRRCLSSTQCSQTSTTIKNSNTTQPHMHTQTPEVTNTPMSLTQRYSQAASEEDLILITNRQTTHTHTHPFNGPLSGTTRVSQYQKGKTNLDITEARDSEWQWHQLGHMQVCTSLQTDNHASTPPLSFFTGRMPFLSPNQQCQSTEGNQQRN